MIKGVCILRLLLSWMKYFNMFLYHLNINFTKLVPKRAPYNKVKKKKPKVKLTSKRSFPLTCVNTRIFERESKHGNR